MSESSRVRLAAAPLVLAAVLILWIAPRQVAAQTTEPDRQQPPAQKPTAPPPVSPVLFENVTVTATLTPLTIRDVPGTVSVIDAAAIERALMANAADLLRFVPGVYVESNVTRIGLNGFNIRGIGGNRVMTRIDGVETSEQFDFGPFNVHQFGLDVDALKTAEILRSAGSSLYGSDALGGVVSFFTKDPADYLRGRRFHSAGKMLFDGRSNGFNVNAVVAGGSSRTQASLFVSAGTGSESGNQGDVETTDSTRTAPNPQDRRSLQALGKLAFGLSPAQSLLVSLEVADNTVETTAYSSRTAGVLDVTSHDTMRRQRVSVDHTLRGGLGLTEIGWSGHFQNSDTAQVVDEDRAPAGATPQILRSGTLDFSQQTLGGRVQGRAVVPRVGEGLLLTFGSTHKRDVFDMLRDRIDTNAVTGAVLPATNLILPTKYFPESVVSETGVYIQGQTRLGRVTLGPGIRYDRFSLDADERDEVFLASLSPAPVDFAADAVSGRVGATFDVTSAVTLHAQYAGGFRTPPYSAVNSGFTNLSGGYTSLPNSDLRPETSDNLETGVRVATRGVSVAATTFVNHYDDFILQELRGFNPQTGLLEFQYMNVSEVEIRGVELQADARISSTLRLRASYAWIRGDDVSGAVDVPLDSIAPDQGALGLEYTDASGRWGADLTLRGATRLSADRAAEGSFVPPAHAVADITGWITLTDRVTLRSALLNASNARYFEWPNVRGRLATDQAIDRYSSPGRSIVLSLGYGW